MSPLSFRIKGLQTKELYGIQNMRETLYCMEHNALFLANARIFNSQWKLTTVWQQKLKPYMGKWALGHIISDLILTANKFYWFRKYIQSDYGANTYNPIQLYASQETSFNWVLSRQNGHHFAKNIYKCIYLDERCYNLILISPKNVPMKTIEISLYRLR